MAAIRRWINETFWMVSSDLHNWWFQHLLSHHLDDLAAMFSLYQSKSMHMSISFFLLFGLWCCRSLFLFGFLCMGCCWWWCSWCLFFLWSGACTSKMSLSTTVVTVTSWFDSWLNCSGFFGALDSIGMSRSAVVSNTSRNSVTFFCQNNRNPCPLLPAQHWLRYIHESV